MINTITALKIPSPTKDPLRNIAISRSKLIKQLARPEVIGLAAEISEFGRHTKTQRERGKKTWPHAE